MKITRRERDYIRPAIIYGWPIVTYCNSRSCWDGDNLMPVAVGPMCEKLIDRGVLERLSEYGLPEKIRATKRSKELKCNAEGCYEGKLYKEDDVVGECKHCEGTGLVLEI